MSFFVGELRHINKLRFWPLEDVIHDKYEFTRETALTIASFFNPMLRLHPEKRAGAGELIHHRWLDGIVVQGEIDVLRRAEEEDRRQHLPATDPSLAEEPDHDALKPVDDSPGTDDEHAAPKLSMPQPPAAVAAGSSSTKAKPAAKTS